VTSRRPAAVGREAVHGDRPLQPGDSKPPLEGAKALDTDPVGVSDGWDPASRAVPIRLTVSLATLQPGSYDCQVTILDPAGNRAAFWRAPIVVIR
jgi:hypothetical protein